ncbi:MAG: protein-export rane protein SecD [Bacilli bacterium]|nr:protein-export rane protein SecD [Bacilli bacterium]
MNGKRFIAFVLIVILALGTIGATSSFLMNKIKLGLDLKGGFEILYTAKPIIAGGVITKQALNETANSLKKRVDPTGTMEPDISPEGKDRIRARIAGVANAEEVRANLVKPFYLNFKKGLNGEILMDGSDFVPNGAKVQYDNSQPIVSIKLKKASKMKEVTTAALNGTMAIYMDDQLLSNPSVHTVIDSDSAVINGFSSLAEVQSLVDKINLGALPLKLEEKYTQSVGASLGKQSLQDTVVAGLIALVIIIVGMIGFYRVPGFIASVTLITYTWMLLLVFYLLNATLTLPGIAAFVLGVGMAVDANIITYERIKEEMRSGKSILSSLRAGSKTSFKTIIDAHVTTLIAGAVLYFIGTGSIQGFALTLIFSILVSLVSNVFLSRLLLQLLVKSGVVNKPGYFGVKEEEISAL